MSGGGVDRAGGAPSSVDALLDRDLLVLDLLPEAIVVVGDDGTIQHVNARGPVLIEIGAEVVGQRLEDVLDLRDDTQESVTSELICGPRPVAERIAERLLYLHVAGARRRPLSVSGTIMDGGGVVLSLRHAGRRERVDAARSDLVATVSHEIRSPLTSVKGFTRTMLSKWDRFSDDQKRQMLVTINEDADRVTRLLTELLDVSRIDVGRVHLDRRLVDLDRIVRGVVDRAAHDAEEREFEVDVADDVPRLLGDPDKLEQVVTNLVDNAVRHAPGSPVRIEVRREHSGNGEPSAVRLSVSDEGPGIRAEDRRRVFGKFSRVDGGRRRAGSGLGLYITKGLVDAHGGQVWVDAAEGEGATFHVRLPIEPPAGGDGGR